MKGFSIVELVVTLAVAGIAVSIVMGIYAVSTRLSDRSSDLLTANEIAYAKLQHFENRRFSDIPVITKDGSGTTTDPDKYVEDFSSELPTSLQAPREAKIYINKMPGSDTLKYIFVRVKYGRDTQAQLVEYGSLIQEGGLGR